LKINFKVNKRYNFFVTLFACAAALWMMVTRFNYPVEKLLTIFWICLAALVLILVITAPLALLLRWLAVRRDRDQLVSQPTPPKAGKGNELP